MKSLSLVKGVLVSFLLLGISEANASIECWYQHIGFSNGLNAVPHQGTYMGDFQTIRFPGTEISAHWDDLLNMSYRIEGWLDTSVGFCQAKLSVYDRSTRQVIGLTEMGPAKTCESGFSVRTSTYFPEPVVRAQLARQEDDRGPVFTGVQYGCRIQ